MTAGDRPPADGEKQAVPCVPRHYQGGLICIRPRICIHRVPESAAIACAGGRGALIVV